MAGSPVRCLAGDRDPADVRRQLSRWTASGKLIQLRRASTEAGLEALVQWLSDVGAIDDALCY